MHKNPTNLAAVLACERLRLARGGSFHSVLDKKVLTIKALREVNKRQATERLDSKEARWLAR